MRSILSALGFGCILALPSTSFATATYFNINAFTYSEAVSIDVMLDDWKGEFKGGENAVAHGRTEIGADWRNWQFSTFYRYDYEMEFSADTAELYHRTSNELPLTTQREYQLDLIARHSITDGLRLGHRFDNIRPGVNLVVGGSYLRGKKLTDGRIHGRAIALNDSDYDFDLAIDYYYSEDKVFDRPVDAPSGYGHSFDLELDWQINPKFSSQLRLEDIFGRIYWRNTPHTSADATSNVKLYNDQGYLQFRPVLRGMEKNRDFTQTLHMHGQLDIHYQLDENSHLIAQSKHYRARRFDSIGASYRFPLLGLRGLYTPDTEAVSIAVETDYWHLAMALDTLDSEESHTVALSTGVHIQF